VDHEAQTESPATRRFTMTWRGYAPAEVDHFVEVAFSHVRHAAARIAALEAELAVARRQAATGRSSDRIFDDDMDLDRAFAEFASDEVESEPSRVWMLGA
jgi:hypothetical protein